MKVKTYSTAVVLHQHPEHTHYDWLLVDPLRLEDSHVCKTFRVIYSPQVWGDGGGFMCGRNSVSSRSII